MWKTSRWSLTEFIIRITDVKPAAVLTLQRKVLSELDGGFVCQKLFFPLSPLSSPYFCPLGQFLQAAGDERNESPHSEVWR